MADSWSTSTASAGRIGATDPEGRSRALSEVTVVIPTALRAFTEGEHQVVIEAATVGQALDLLEARYRGVLPRILSADGSLRPFVNVFVDETSTRSLAGMDTVTPHGSVLSIIPAVAGG